MCVLWAPECVLETLFALVCAQHMMASSCAPPRPPFLYHRLSCSSLPPHPTTRKLWGFSLSISKLEAAGHSFAHCRGWKPARGAGRGGGAGTWSIWARTELTWSASAKLVSAVLTRRSAPRAPGTRVCVSVCAR